MNHFGLVSSLIQKLVWLAPVFRGILLKLVVWVVSSMLCFGGSTGWGGVVCLQLTFELALLNLVLGDKAGPVAENSINTPPIY